MFPDAARHRRRHVASLVAVILASAIVAGGCAASFDPDGPCVTDGRVPGAYPSLEALVPRDLGGQAPTTVDSGRNCTERALGSLVRHGVDELRFAGATWETGTSSGVTLAVLEAPDLTAEWVHEFYRLGAENARNTESVDASAFEVAGKPGFRIDTLNGESYQTVIDWQDGDRVRVVLVSSFVRQVTSRSEHEATVSAAMETATGQTQ
jgi:hypothetical protein